MIDGGSDDGVSASDTGAWVDPRHSVLADTMAIAPHLRHAEGLMARREFAVARIAAQQAVAIDPASATAWLLLGIAQSHVEGHADNITSLTRATRIDPGEVRGWLGLARLAWSGGRLREAVVYYRAAAALDDRLFEPWERVGDVLLMTGHFGEARGQFVEALRRKGDAPWLWRKLAETSLRLGDPGEARVCFQEAIRQAPTDPETLNAWGVFLQGQGDLEGATLAVGAALALAPENQALLVNAAVLATLSAMSARSRMLRLRAVRVDPTVAGVWAGLARDCGTGGPSLGVSHWHRAIALAPDDDGILADRAAGFVVAGALPPAARWADRASRLAPTRGDRYRDWARVEAGLGKGNTAARLWRTAIALEPAWMDAAYAETLEGPERRLWLRRALRLDSNDEVAWVGLLRDHDIDGGDFGGGGERVALAVRPGSPDLWRVLSVKARQRGDMNAALAAARRATRCAPEDGRVWFGLAIEAAGEGLADEAIAAYRRAARALDHDPAIWRGLAQTLRSVGDHAAASTAIRVAVALAPDDPAVTGDAGLTAAGLGAEASAQSLLRRAVRITPYASEWWYHLGLRLSKGGRRSAYLAAWHRALAVDPSSAFANAGLAWSFEIGGSNTRALAFYERAALVGNDPAISVCRALLYLEKSDIGRGWELYLSRIDSLQRFQKRHFTVPRWRGETLAGKRLLIWREQGVGDEILFASCYADVIASAQAVIIECEPRLVDLFSRSFPTATVRAQTSEAVVTDTRTCDLHVPAGDLPRYVRADLGAFRAKSGRWLVPAPEQVERWKVRLAALGPGLRVGIAWRSLLMTFDRDVAYLTLAEWKSFFDIPGIIPINLQYGDCTAEITDAERRFGVKVHTWPDINLKDDFDDVAALAANLDLIVAPANAVAELGGALGVPVWRFGCAKDWTRLGVAGTRPWTPSIRIFQARPTESVLMAFERICTALLKLMR